MYLESGWTVKCHACGREGQSFGASSDGQRYERSEQTALIQGEWGTEGLEKAVLEDTQGHSKKRRGSWSTEAGLPGGGAAGAKIRATLQRLWL